MYRTESYPRDAAVQQTRAMPPLGLLRHRRLALECLLHLPCAYVHGLPTFFSLSLSFSASLSCAFRQREEKKALSFSGNARRSPGRRKRESPVLQSRSGGPEGRSSVTLRTIPRSFAPFSLPCHSFHRAFDTRRLSCFLPLFRRLFRPRERAIAIGSLCPRAREFS